MPFVKVTTEDGSITSEEFDQVRMLPNGWVKCSTDRHQMDTYYPPDRVHEITADSENVYHGTPTEF